MPRVMRYLRRASARYRELKPLLGLLDQIEHRQPVVGVGF
jgi:aminoglycoside/choline kinase family phosphotransferase